MSKAKARKPHVERRWMLLWEPDKHGGIEFGVGAGRIRQPNVVIDGITRARSVPVEIRELPAKRKAVKRDN